MATHLVTGNEARQPWWPDELGTQAVDGRLRFAVGSNFLEDFAADHSPADMLRELVQNEYDAGGSRLEATFETTGLRVTGNGNPIDAAGWRRLSVMFSTGRVAGGVAEDGEVDAKVNGIGSKNAGLRTLFLIGDRIHVRSNGKYSLLDLRQGTLPAPDPDPGSRGTRGVEIVVPYRESNGRLLQAFTEESELEALESFSSELSQVLLKLAQPGSRRNLSHLVVTSRRHTRRVSWTQAVRRVPSAVPGITAVRREIRRYDSRAPSKVARSEIDELEFQRSISPPAALLGQDVPRYFRQSNGRIRLSVSTRLRGERPDPKSRGLFYYPIGIKGASTGTAISVCAPFLMNTERTAIIEQHPWNIWLQESAAELAVDLLTADWTARFGPDAFRILLNGMEEAESRFHAAVEDALRSQACWPSRARQGRSIQFSKAVDLVVPANEALIGYITDESRALDDRFAANDDVVGAAKEFGAKTFSVNSFVRLRCAPTTGVVLSTKLADKTEANFAYGNFPGIYEGASGLSLQRRMGQTLDSQSRHLSTLNRADLRDQPATLAADGTLAAPKDLWYVPPAIAHTTHVPAPSRLHPDLGESKTLSQLCKRFKVDGWLLDLCAAARAAEASEADLEAVSSYIKAVHGRVSSRVRGAVRRSPVVRDHRGTWVAPESLTSKSAPGATLLEPVLHFPSADILRDSRLMSQLAIRQRIADNDIVEFAHSHVTASDVSEQFQAILWARRQQLSSRIIGRLADAKFLRSTFEDFDSPGALYISNPSTIASVGDHAPFVLGSHTELYRRLGCADQARSVDVIANLEAMSSRGEAPARPDILYPALVKALRSERAALGQFSEKPIIWASGAYAAPSDVLVGTRFPSVLTALPHVRGGESLQESLIDLGAHFQPQDRHWRAFFALFGARYRSGSRASPADARMLREAYGRRGRLGLPAELRSNVACLLGRDGAVYSQSDVSAGRFVLNDHPALADAASDQGTPIAFPDRDERAQDFFGAIGLKSLTDIAGTPDARIGTERSAPAFLHETELLARIHADDFASALAALARHELRDGSRHATHASSRLRRRLREITRVAVVESVTLRYSIGRFRVAVPAEFWLAPSTIYLAQARSIDGVRGLVAMAIADVIRAPIAQRQRLADSIYRLLSARRIGEMADYLRMRGVDWAGSSGPELDDDDQEGEGLGETLGDLGRSLLDQARSRGSSPSSQSTGDRPPPTPAQASEPPPLPPLEEVTLKEAPADADWTRPERSGSGGGGGGQWRPKSAAEVARDQATGRRAEELVLRNERERVRRLGFDADRVIWTSDGNPGADHDIRSVDDDGGDLWLEVKGTVGTDGRFPWPVAEFTKALVERSRYILWRVYEADTDHPTAKPFRDPIAMLGSEQVRVDIASLAMEVEPLEPH